jgi:type IV pilus assembly protein PilV
MRRAAGFMMMEVLITIVIIAIGLLGLAGLQARTTTAEMESYQRVQALVLAQDMADRMIANKTNAASYAGSDYGTGAAVTCDPATYTTRATMDLCEWGNAIRGTAEQSGSSNIGALLSGRGCITANGTNQYLVTVVWQGMMQTAEPFSSVTCGSGSYGSTGYRRALFVVVNTAPIN